MEIETSNGNGECWGKYLKSTGVAFLLKFCSRKEKEKSTRSSCRNALCKNVHKIWQCWTFLRLWMEKVVSLWWKYSGTWALQKKLHSQKFYLNLNFKQLLSFKKNLMPQNKHIFSNKKSVYIHHILSFSR